MVKTSHKSSKSIDSRKGMFPVPKDCIKTLIDNYQLEAEFGQVYDFQ